MLTDSGGFQVFSLSGSKDIGAKQEPGLMANRQKPRKLTEEGVTFYSHLDGSKHFISPEKSIKIQENLGADIIMAFDHVPSADASKKEAEQAMERTHRWLQRCIKAKKLKSQALFPICQGGQFKDLRLESANFIKSLDLPGNAIGGVSVGEKKEKIYEVTRWCTDILPESKPRYLMGIGYPEDICRVIKLGIDMFDCVLPTRLARHGNVWVKKEYRIKNTEYSKNLPGMDYGYEQVDLLKKKNLSAGPIDKKCTCPACRGGFSRIYLNHLLKERETLGMHLLTIHNLYFTFNLVSDITGKIPKNTF
jgi:queuine tRNA-ribosyltransferase